MRECIRSRQEEQHSDIARAHLHVQINGSSAAELTSPCPPAAHQNGAETLRRNSAISFPKIKRKCRSFLAHGKAPAPSSMQWHENGVVQSVSADSYCSFMCLAWTDRSWLLRWKALAIARSFLAATPPAAASLTLPRQSVYASNTGREGHCVRASAATCCFERRPLSLPCPRLTRCCAVRVVPLRCCCSERCCLCP